MATRSYICIELTDELKKKFKTEKQYMCVYSHFDGGLDVVGSILHYNYNTYKKALQLIKHGEIRSLESTIKDTSFFDPQQKRLLRNKLHPSIFFLSDIDLTPHNTQMIAYVYIMRLNGLWEMRSAVNGYTYLKNYGYLALMPKFDKPLI